MSIQQIVINLSMLNAVTAQHYLTFSIIRFIKGIVSTPMSFINLLITVSKCSGYMSTRISGVSNFKQLAADRAATLSNPLNPTELPIIAGWSGKEYMVFWYTVIVLIRIQGKPLYSFTEDLTSSRGCNLEVLFAKRIGMTVHFN